jgi:hypothetical protein
VRLEVPPRPHHAEPEQTMAPEARKRAIRLLALPGPVVGGESIGMVVNPHPVTGPPALLLSPAGWPGTPSAASSSATTQSRRS